jgi:peptidoglycan/xylan/chitin deacetylase (PgdA/CDA1 family)
VARARTAAGATVPGSPFRVALTFDAEHRDRPSAAGVQERLLDVLAREAVPATFFIQGRWAEAYPETARRIPQEGHLVGNHSHYHVRMPLLNVGGLRADIADGEAAIIDATGADPRPWFRCPFGAGAGNQRVQRIVHEAGYRHVGWHVDGFDFSVERSADEVEAQVLAGTFAHGDGTVVLLHAWADRTEAAIPRVVRRLRDAGAELVRIDQLPSDLVPAAEVNGTLFVSPSQA